jgi:hypothetical protein
MGYFYFDESIHDRGGFIIGAFVYTKQDQSEIIKNKLIENGFQPGVHEFKSSLIFNNNDQNNNLRNALIYSLQDTRIGIVILPNSEREMLGLMAVKSLKSIIKENGLWPERHEAYFDEGIFKNINYAQELASIEGLDAYCDCHFEQNSKSIYCLQLADLVAHTCSEMLLEKLGLISKSVKLYRYGDERQELNINLGFELWMQIRYYFFFKFLGNPDSDDPWEICTVDVEPYGLVIAESCSKELAEASRSRFGKMYLGCTQ